MSQALFRRRSAAFCLALAVAAPVHAAGLDIAAEWRDFLANAEAKEVYPAFGTLVNAVEANGEVAPETCRAKADDIVKATEVVPVSAQVNYVAYRCAQALGDAAAEEKYAVRFAAIARHALAVASDDWMDRPIPVIGGNDIYAILRGAGLELRYERLDPYTNGRHAIVRIAAWDPEAKIERFYAFDYLDVVMRLNRSDANAAYPQARSQYWRYMVRAMAEAKLVMGVDMAATMASFDQQRPQDRADVLRPAAEQGGLQASLVWMGLCHKKPFAGCGEGVVDALLPHVEDGKGMHTVLLAMAYGDGIGVAKDEVAAQAMLGKAAAIMGRSRAVTAYGLEYQLMDSRPFPEFLRKELQALATEGDAMAVVMLALDAMVASEDGRIPAPLMASLQQHAEAGVTSAARMLGQEYVNRDDYAKALPFLRTAAEAGDAQSQDLYARLLSDGDVVAADPVAARRWWELAAAGGDRDAMAAMSTVAGNEGDWPAQEQWLRNAADAGNKGAAIELARQYLQGGKDREPDRAAGLALLARIDDPDARRALAYAYLEKDAPDRDVAKAEALYRQDAEAGDMLSRILLGLGWLEGDLGKVDEAEGLRWLDKGLKENDDDTVDAYATHLYYRGGTPESRQRALAMWRAQLARKADTGGRNNLAWALCTSNDPAVRAADEGLVVARGMGEPDDLSSTYLDTLASCHAASGDYSEAERLQQRVADEFEKSYGSDGDTLAGMRKRLALYAAGKAYIETERAE